MNKTEQIKKRNNLIFLFAGFFLILLLLFIYREGYYWFTTTRWQSVSVFSWVSITFILIIASLLQYYFFLLLRYSIFKYLVFWIIPIAWLVNNGLAAMHKFLDWTGDIASSASWIPIGDLLGWLLSAVYFPLLVGSGAIIAIIDSSGSMLSQACYYAGIALDVTGISSSNIISYSMNILSVVWDLITNSFVNEIVNEAMKNRSFLEFNLSTIFSLPYWFLNIGYNISCIII